LVIEVGKDRRRLTLTHSSVDNFGDVNIVQSGVVEAWGVEDP